MSLKRRTIGKVTEKTRHTRALALWVLVSMGPFIGVELARAQGTITTPIGSGSDEADAVALQADGKIVAAGWTQNGGDDDFAVLRYHADLSLDTSFDSDGIASTSFGSGEDRANAVAIQSDGKIVVAGHQ